MSKVSIQGDQNGTGDFTIKAPNSNTSRTLNLPDEAGTVLTNVSDIETQVKTATNATGSAPVYACRAWVDFHGNINVIRGSGNVSSITDNGDGDYTINFVSAMPDNNFAITGQALNLQTNNFSDARNLGAYPENASSARIFCHRFTDETSNNPEYVQVAVFR
jgi:hypothetical protein